MGTPVDPATPSMVDVVASSWQAWVPTHLMTVTKLLAKPVDPACGRVMMHVAELSVSVTSPARSVERIVSVLLVQLEARGTTPAGCNEVAPLTETTFCGMLVLLTASLAGVPEEPPTIMSPDVVIGFDRPLLLKGPTVTPATRPKKPAEVLQKSPLFGEVGAVPGGIFRPAED